jgi:ligand-binding SRPBCC domain-containing protein
MYGELASLLFADHRIVSKKIDPAFFRFPNIESALDEIYGGLQSGEKRVHYDLWLPKPVQELFPFFESAKNLEELTPKFLHFEVLRQSTDAISAGTLIDYRLRLHGIPFRWQTRIEKFEINREFIDTEVHGPFEKWHHVHRFEPLHGGTLCSDTVTYKLPLARVGEWGGGAWVRGDVERIFEYRRDTLFEKFGD